MNLLQSHIDEFEKLGVLVTPESAGITPAHVSPSFLVKKSNNRRYRLVTDFSMLNKFIRPLPCSLGTTEDLLHTVSQ